MRTRIGRREVWCTDNPGPRESLQQTPAIYLTSFTLYSLYRNSHTLYLIHTLRIFFFNPLATANQPSWIAIPIRWFLAKNLFFILFSILQPRQFNFIIHFSNLLFFLSYTFLTTSIFYNTLLSLVKSIIYWLHIDHILFCIVHTQNIYCQYLMTFQMQLIFCQCIVHI